MSTVILLFLAMVIIFWRPPFRLPRMTKKTIAPVILFIMLSSLLLLGTFKSNSTSGCSTQAESQEDTKTHARQQTLLSQ